MSKKTILFILLAVAVVALFLILIFSRGGIFSKEILRLEVLGPEKAEAGQEIEYAVKYKNNGDFVLESPKLIFEMPEYSLTEDGKTRITQDLEDIYPGDEQVVKIKTRLLGKEKDLKTAKASLSYMPKNLTVRYESKTTFTTEIETVPITLDFDLPSKIEKGKEVQYSINYFSNIDYPLENLGLKISPIQGFEVVYSDASSLDNLEWRLPTLTKAQGGRINIRGRVVSETDQNLTFLAQLGMWQGGNFVVIKETKEEVQSIQPLLSISQQVNGSPSYVASPGETLHYQIFFRNVGSTPFDDLFMVVKLDGVALDLSTIQAKDGQIQPDDNMIIWDSNQVSQLRHLGVQQEGQIDFFVKLKNDWVSPGADPESTIITTQVNISQITQKFTTKVNSGMVISQSAYYKSYEIENSGPVPPEAGKATQYVITWDIRNYFSDAKNVKVKATLPNNVKLTGKIMPPTESSNFSFDSESREIVWSAGDILAGTGVKGDPYTISFQVALTPSSSQRGSTAPLINQVQLSGENQFTNTIITAQDAGINTSLPDDFANSGGGIVQ